MSDDSFYDDNPSDATILLEKEVTKEFKKAFPLRSERERAVQSQLARRTPAVCKRLNFDETLSPIALHLNAEVKSVKVSLETNNRKLALSQEELAGVKSLLQEKEKQNDTLMSERSALRQSVANLEMEMKRMRREFDEKSSHETIALEDWRAIGRKYFLWFTMASTQLEAFHAHVTSGNEWSEEIVDKINKIPMECMKTKVEDFTEDYISQLAQGSIHGYDGVEFRMQNIENVRSTVDETQMSMLAKPANETVLGEQSFNVSQFTSLSPIRACSPGDSIMQVSINTNKSSIDYERDEKIQRLLLENSVLKDRLDVSVGRAQQSMLIEEKNRSLELKNDYLQKKLDTTFGEIEAMRVGTARRLFSIDEERAACSLSNSLVKGNKALAMVDRIRELVSDNTKLEKNIESATSKIAKLTKTLSECEKRNDHLEESYSKQVTKCLRLEKEKEAMEATVAVQEKEIVELKDKVARGFSQVQEAVTDAGNSTQIFHMPLNPLQAAHAEFHESESRKRKLSDIGETESDDVKRRRDEESAQWEEKMRKVEREKDSAIGLQKDLIRKFREVSTALTGFQIKLKDADEGICSVNSIYEEEGSDRQFVFKYYWENGRFDLLDVGCDTAESTNMIEKWKHEMRKYIGERQSIPSFLAAVTLRMEQERNFDQTLLERTHTFSVLHE